MEINYENSVRLPVLPLRGLVIYPMMTLDFEVGRKMSAAALSATVNTGGKIFLITQKDVTVDEPTGADLYKIGCVARIKQMLRRPDGSFRVIAEGEYRAVAENISKKELYYRADAIRIFDEDKMSSAMRETVCRKIKELFDKYASEAPKLAPDIITTVIGSDDPAFLSDFIAFNLIIPEDDKQFILEQKNVMARAKLLLKMLERECQIQKLDRKISEKVRFQLDENQKDYYLREQLKVINNELYGDDTDSEIENYYAKIHSLNADTSVKERLNTEVSRLAKMPQGSHEGTVSRIFLDTCLELPWNCVTNAKVNIKKAKKILDRDFYGLDKVKQRILELVSVYKIKPDVKGQIICFAGPPGVGKTHIAKSIAECMDRRYARIALGGIHDEAEMRGHRKTYIGAMPGRIIEAIKKAGSSNPLILLDEIDKLGKDYKGDPSNALLEVLDPEQNSTFHDHFIDMPYDLSKVVFIATANDINAIPEALYDRLEVIELSGYTEEDKLAIAKRHLIPKQVERHGLTKDNIRFTDGAVNTVIDCYTRESGVRELDRVIGSICRKTAKRVAEGNTDRLTVTDAEVKNMLGAVKYKNEAVLTENSVGIINGLAWTAAGGRLMGLEVAVVEGSGKIELTGSLGDIMKESARAAVTYVRYKAEELGIDPLFYKNRDIHIHATESATPKDGPSAGVTIASALISALTGRKVKQNVALTGEVSILGRVFPIGGLKEKSMAAMRNKIDTVLIPYDNIPDLEDIDKKVKQLVHFVPCKTMDDVLKYILEPKNEGIDIIPERSVRPASMRQ